MLTKWIASVFLLISAALATGSILAAEITPSIIVEGAVIDRSDSGDSAAVETYEVEILQMVHGQPLWNRIFVRPLTDQVIPPPVKYPRREPDFAVGDLVYLVLRPVEGGVYEILSWRPLADPPDEPDSLAGPLTMLADEAPAKHNQFPKAETTAPTPSFEERVVELVNEQRWSHNNSMLPPLNANSLLGDSSFTHSANMAERDFFAHCDLDTGDDPFDRMLAAGYAYNYAGENIAAGYATPESVMSGWMNSAGHRANILRDNFREIGVGYYLQSGDSSNVRWDSNSDCEADTFNQGPYAHYWTQNFGLRDTVYPVVIDREAIVTNTPTVDLYIYGAGWAQDMRFSNDGVNYSSWEAYTPDKSWELSSGNGYKTVYVQIGNGGAVLQSEDQIYLDATCTGYPVSLELSNQTVTNADEQIACNWIRAGNNFHVAATGDFTMRAGETVILQDGFSVAAGGTFRAIIDPTL